MKIHRIVCVIAIAVGAQAESRAADLTRPVNVRYTKGSEGVALTALMNETGSIIYDFRINFRPGIGENELFNLDASDCDVDPGRNPDGDGSVGATDLRSLLTQWGTDPGGPPGFDGDGSVGAFDLLTLLGNWERCP